MYIIFQKIVVYHFKNICTVFKKCFNCSTQNREERDKEAGGAGSKETKPSKNEQDQIQYIEGEGCQVWRPQVGPGVARCRCRCRCIGCRCRDTLPGRDTFTNTALLFGVRGVSTSTSKKVYKRLKDRFDGKLE